MFFVVFQLIGFMLAILRLCAFMHQDDEGKRIHNGTTPQCGGDRRLVLFCPGVGRPDLLGFKPGCLGFPAQPVGLRGV